MKYFALAVLLAVMQASPPVPRRAADNSQQHTEDAQHTVGVSKLPTVTVTPPKRDWADWGYWAFSALLVIVGALQIVLLCWTLRVIRRQAAEMIRQRILMRRQWTTMTDQLKEFTAQTVLLGNYVEATRDGVTAAKKSADALINSERSWVMVDVEWEGPTGHLINLSSSTPDPNQVYQTQIYVNLICVNRGKSPAWVVERIAKAEIAGAFYGPNLSAVNDSEIDRRLISLGMAGTPEARTEQSIKLYAPGSPGNKYVLVYGVVKYRDAFTPKGELRETWFGYYALETRMKEPLARISQAEYNNYT